ncbi:hypothetical protein [Pseudomonas phage vB_PaeM_PS119XW]|uniref:Virion structural protein n=1 Tax=Pseudomonas phage vB_PaeM_PS119XW TaxID=2601632 RepID=A0A5C1K8K1_9CAUD|nr:virion structural protein [Pseudomonas phage vB_PaeM_PS119XW]QEM41821.1 hypothetical protein [Pseudomonas phage vB_PaeM_PS119XW]
MHEYDDVLIEGQRQLGEELEAAPVRGVQLDPNLQEKLHAALEHISTLDDLRSTIRAEGVSSHDITALRGIHSSMEAIGLNVPVLPSLENYNALFTPTRTSLNLKVSNEAIGSAIMATIKEWFHVLVDFIVKTIRWVKSVEMNDEVIQGRIVSINEKIVKLESNWKEMQALNRLGNRNLDRKYYEAAEVVLLDPKLPRSDIGLLAFGVDDDLRRIRNIQQEAQKFGAQLLEQIRQLRQVMDRSRLELGFESHIGPRLQSLAETLKNMDSQSDDPNFYIKHKRVGIRFFEDTKRMLKREPITYKFIYELYGKCADELRKVNRFDLEESVVPLPKLQAVIANVNAGIEALNDMVKVFSRIPLYQYKAGATYANFFIKAHDIVREDFYAHVASDVANAAWDKLIKRFEDIKRELGI